MYGTALTSGIAGSTNVNLNVNPAPSNADPQTLDSRLERALNRLGLAAELDDLQSDAKQELLTALENFAPRYEPTSAQEVVDLGVLANAAAIGSRPAFDALCTLIDFGVVNANPVPKPSGESLDTTAASQSTDESPGAPPPRDRPARARSTTLLPQPQAKTRCMSSCAASVRANGNRTCRSRSV